MSQLCISSGLAQFVRMANSNCKVASSMSTLGILHYCVFGKTLNAGISDRVHIANARLSTFGSVPKLNNVPLRPWKRHFTLRLP